MMKLYQRLESIMVQFRPVFSRQATFAWFVLLLWGILLNDQPPAVTSYVNVLGLEEGYYHQALHWFHSSGFSIEGLCQAWSKWLSGYEEVHRLKGHRVYVGDGIKVAKEGRKMPGVKGLHQESDDVSKPEWIRGHYFSALGVLLGAKTPLFASPIVLKLHDGIEPTDSATASLSVVDKMAQLCVSYLEKGSYVLLDAYYAAAPLLAAFQAANLHLISRVRITSVAHAPFCARPGKHGPGRPRKWGAPIKIRELFEPIEDCDSATVHLYGQSVKVAYQCFEFYWDSPTEPRLFILTQLPCGKQIILISSDTSLSALQVIEAYGWRFKIEVSFRTLVHLLGGFRYQFWSDAIERLPSWPKNLKMAEYPQAVQPKIERKIEAFERFVNLNAIALGILQVLALELPEQVWTAFPLWFRTLPKHGYPSERIVRLALENQLAQDLSKSRPTLLLDQFLQSKRRQHQTQQNQHFAA